MNPNDLADFSGDTSDTVIRRSIVSNDGHRILVVGTIPEQGVPMVGIQVDAVSIQGSMDTMASLEEALSDMLMDMDDQMMSLPLTPCKACGGRAKIGEVTSDKWKGVRYDVTCIGCGLYTKPYIWKSDASYAWRDGQYLDPKEVVLKPCLYCGKEPEVTHGIGMWYARCGCPGMSVARGDERNARMTWNSLVTEYTRRRHDLYRPQDARSTVSPDQCDPCGGEGHRRADGTDLRALPLQEGVGVHLPGHAVQAPPQQGARQRHVPRVQRSPCRARQGDAGDRGEDRRDGMTDLGLNTDTNVQVPREHSGRMENPDRPAVELSDRELHQLYAGLVLFFGTFLTVTFTILTKDTLCGAILEGGAILLAWFVATQPSSKD